MSHVYPPAACARMNVAAHHLRSIQASGNRCTTVILPSLAKKKFVEFGKNWKKRISILRIHYSLNIRSSIWFENDARFRLFSKKSDRPSLIQRGRESGSTHTAIINNDERPHFLPSDHTRLQPLVFNDCHIFLNA